MYYRLYITYTLAGFLFDLDQSNICRDIQKIEPLVRKCVPIPQKMHKTTKGCAHQKKLKSTFLALLLSQIARNSRYQDLKTKRRRKTYYSGKKKRHTVKTQLMVNNLRPYHP